MKPSILLALIKHCGSSGNPSRSHWRKDERGFSLVVVLLVVLTVILGSLAIVNRATAGRLAATFQISNREARETAETGIVVIVSELNKEANRKILVSGQSPSAWTQSDTNLVNPCTGFTSAGVVQATSTPTATAINYKSGAVTSGTRQYQLESITYSQTPTRTQST
jgi:Tfp pilus assembly protein PilV